MRLFLLFLLVTATVSQEHRSAKVLQPLLGLQSRLCRGDVHIYSACSNAMVSASFTKEQGETFHRVDSGIKMVDVPTGCKVTIYSKMVDEASPVIGSQAGSHSVVIKGPREKFCIEKMLQGGVAIGIEDDADLSDAIGEMKKLASKVENLERSNQLRGTPHGGHDGELSGPKGDTGATGAQGNDGAIPEKTEKLAEEQEKSTLQQLQEEKQKEVTRHEAEEEKKRAEAMGEEKEKEKKRNEAKKKEEELAKKGQEENEKLMVRETEQREKKAEKEAQEKRREESEKETRRKKVENAEKAEMVISEQREKNKRREEEQEKIKLQKLREEQQKETERHEAEQEKKLAEAMAEEKEKEQKRNEAKKKEEELVKKGQEEKEKLMARETEQREKKAEKEAQEKRREEHEKEAKRQLVEARKKGEEKRKLHENWLARSIQGGRVDATKDDFDGTSKFVNLDLKIGDLRDNKKLTMTDSKSNNADMKTYEDSYNSGLHLNLNVPLKVAKVGFGVALNHRNLHSKSAVKVDNSNVMEVKVQTRSTMDPNDIYNKHSEFHELKKKNAKSY